MYERKIGLYLEILLKFLWSVQSLLSFNRDGIIIIIYFFLWNWNGF